MQEIRIKVKLEDSEVERLDYLKELFGIKTNASLLRLLLRVKI